MFQQTRRHTLTAIQSHLTQLTELLPELQDQAQAAGQHWAALRQEFDLLSEEVHQQDLILNTAAAIADTVDTIAGVDGLVQAVVELIAHRFTFERVALYLTDESGQWAELRAAVDPPDPSPKAPKLPISDDNVVGQAIFQQKAVLLNGNGAGNGNGHSTPPLHTGLVLPLINRGEVLGALTVGHETPSLSPDFYQDNLAAMETLAIQVANAIQNTRLFATIDEQLEQMATLYHISLQVGSHLNINLQLNNHSLDFDALLDNLAQLSLQLTNAEASAVHLIEIDKHTPTVIRTATHHAGNTAAGSNMAELETDLSRYVFQTRQAVLGNNWPTHPLAQQHATSSVNGSDILALMNVPIVLRGHTIGTIEVQHFSQDEAFDDNDLHILSLLASQAAVAIENTHLYNQAESNSRFLKAVIEHIPDPIFIKDRNHTWIEMNQANADVIGRPAFELIGKTDQDFFPTDLADEFYRRDDEIFINNQTLTVEDQTVWADGQEHVAFTRLIPIDNNQGRPQYLLGITHDVTELRARAAERERLLAEMATLYNGSQAIAQAISERQVFEALFEQIWVQAPDEILAYYFISVSGEPIWIELTASWQKTKQTGPAVGSRRYLPEATEARWLTATEPTYIESVAQDERLSQSERESFVEKGAASVVILPLTTTGQEIGVVLIYFAELTQFETTIRRFWQAMVDQASVLLANRHLIQEVAYRAVQIETAADVTRTASSILDVNLLLNSAARLIRERFDLYYVGVFLVDKAKKWAILRAGTGQEGQIQLKNNHRLEIGGESMIGWCLANLKARIALDVGQEAVHFQNPHLPHTRSEMALPLIYRNKATGALTVQSTEPAAFNQADIIFLQTMADQLANAIENARLFEQAQQEIVERKRIEQEILKRNNELAAINRVTEAVTSTLEFQSVLQAIAREMALIFEARTCGIALLNTDRTELTVIADHSLDPEDPASAVGVVIPVEGNPSSSHVIETGQSIIVAEAQTNPMIEPIHQLMRERQTQALVIIPLKARGEVIGTIGLDTNQADRAFSESDVGLAETIAAQVAGVVENAQLFERTQAAFAEQKRAEQALRDSIELEELVATASQTFINLSSHRIDEGINYTLRAVGEFFEANRSYVFVIADEETTISNSHEWCADQVHPQINDLQNISTKTIPWWLEKIKTSEIIDIPQPAHLPPEAQAESERLGVQPGQSCIIIPLIYDGAPVGFVGFDCVEQDRRWSDEEIRIFKVIGQIIVSALERKNAGRALQDALAKNRTLLTETQHRSNLLETGAEISRTASSILDADQLIRESVNLIRDKFDFYYVGLFLIDPANKWAVLRAGTGEAGRVQLAKGHRLEIGGDSMIGWSVAQRQARIALDVGEDAVHFENPALPDTRSEMALPLISRDQAIGALTVQSVEPGAFSPEDITLLQTMADQLANAIQNARLFEEASQAQEEAEDRLQETIALQQLSQALSGTLQVQEILDIFFRACTRVIGFEYVIFSQVDQAQQRVKAIAGIGVSDNNLKRANHPLDSTDIMADVIRTGETEIITGWDDRFDPHTFDAEGHTDWIRLFIPVTLRRENVGLVEAGFNKNIQKEIDEKEIDESQIRLLRAFIDQTILALDNAQRYEASQRTARREALIKEITTRVRASTDMDTILQTTAKELGEAINGKRAYVQLLSPTLPTERE